MAILLLVAGVGAAAAEDQAIPEEQLVFFEREVKPILRANCIACHGAEKKIQGKLKLTSRETVLAGGESGPAVSLESPDESLLLEAINYSSFEMPPKGKLPLAQIETLTKWVKIGLPWPEGERGNLIQHGPPVVDEAARNFWAFRPVVRPAVPTVKDASWVRNPIDAFILAKLEEKGLRPAPPADKAALVRRVHYSITGLPPTLEEVMSWEGEAPAEPAQQKLRPPANFDASYEAIVDRLLASRHYGEHWGRHWLDLVRYAESNSFERDNPKPFVWRYRDYVIRSLNEDKPYDQFIREQLAGDELDEVTSDSIIATGYYRLGLWDDEPADPLLAYYDGLDDIVATTGQAFLGLTMNCARCHDHKIDPIPQRDYYQMVAFFHGIKHYGVRADETVAANSLRFIGTEEERRKHTEQFAEYERQVADIDRQCKEIEDPLVEKLPGGERDDFKYPRYRVRILRKHVGELISQETLDRYIELREQAERLVRDRPAMNEQALCVKEDSQPHETFVLLRGNPQSHGDKVVPAFPAVLTAAGATPPEITRPASGESSGRRRVLADWIASEQNPLTARVIANRVWQYHFGRGIVRSSSNFGYLGTPPTHPELLDWLASELVHPTPIGDYQPRAWSLKHLHRLILTSNAYRMSVQADPKAAEIDPENDLLSHFDLRRLTAEEVRDSILAAAGNLNFGKQDGLSIYPEIPREVLAGQSMPGANWKKSSPEEAASRSVFVHIKRSLAVPILAAFDAPDPDAPCPVRFTTTQPTQALGMLNSQFLNSQAEVFAHTVKREAGSQRLDQIRLALRRVLQRVPTDAEIDRGAKFIAALIEQEKLSEDEALRQFCLLALNLNEFVYLE